MLEKSLRVHRSCRPYTALVLESNTLPFFQIAGRGAEAHASGKNPEPIAKIHSSHRNGATAAYGPVRRPDGGQWDQIRETAAGLLQRFLPVGPICSYHSSPSR